MQAAAAAGRDKHVQAQACRLFRVLQTLSEVRKSLMEHQFQHTFFIAHGAGGCRRRQAWRRAVKATAAASGKPDPEAMPSSLPHACRFACKQAGLKGGAYKCKCMGSSSMEGKEGEQHGNHLGAHVCSSLGRSQRRCRLWGRRGHAGCRLPSAPEGLERA